MVVAMEQLLFVPASNHSEKNPPFFFQVVTLPHNTLFVHYSSQCVIKIKTCIQKRTKTNIMVLFSITCIFAVRFYFFLTVEIMSIKKDALVFECHKNKKECATVA